MQASPMVPIPGLTNGKQFPASPENVCGSIQLIFHIVLLQVCLPYLPVLFYDPHHRKSADRNCRYKIAGEHNGKAWSSIPNPGYRYPTITQASQHPLELLPQSHNYDKEIVLYAW